MSAPSQQRLDYWKRRARDAEKRLEYEEEHARRLLDWMDKHFMEERRLRARCTFLYGAAIAYGATHEDLRGLDDA